jgi:hypothetical protein
MALSIAHTFELHAVGIEEEYGVVVVVMFGGRINDAGALLFEERLQRVHVLAAAQAKGIVVEANVPFAVFVLPALCVCLGNPEQGLAVGPAHHALVFRLHAEAEKLHQGGVEGLRFFEIAHADDQMIDADNAYHACLHRCCSHA